MTSNQKIRLASFAGQFYPSDSSRLKAMIDSFLDIAPGEGAGKIKAIIVPHAGYSYSGRVAAYAYRLLSRQKIETAVIVSNAHRVYFSGIAFDDSDFWQTPLGRVKVDQEAARKMMNSDESFFPDSSVHEKDHVIEVQLPFLQTIAGDGLKIIPALFGCSERDGPNKSFALVAGEILGENDILVVSSDLSHYPCYEDANRIDRRTLEIIVKGTVGELEEHIIETMAAGIGGEETLICGINGIKTAMELASEKNWQGKILIYANSGDAAPGDKENVVGYGAVIFTE